MKALPAAVNVFVADVAQSKFELDKPVVSICGVSVAPHVTVECLCLKTGALAAKLEPSEILDSVKAISTNTSLVAT
jgi:hypothetical protein